MSTTCKSFVVPTFETDICNGETKPATCIIDSNTYTQLGLTTNSSQQEINQALYVALISLKNQVENLQEIIDNL